MITRLSEALCLSSSVFQKRRRSLFFIIFILPLASGCIGFAYQEPRTVGLSGEQAVSQISSVRVEGAADSRMKDRCSLHLDFAGWDYFPEDQKELLRTLEKNGIRSNPESSLVLEITLEQTDITPLWRRLPNVIVTVLTSTLFPLVEYFEYHLTFRLIGPDGQLGMKQYRIMSHTILSGLVTPLTPFYYPPAARQEALAESATDFASFCHPFSD
ncbi:MAG: hypothetical protein CMF59_11200 [Leptospiraceae bacterium]|nr:hypothetical protein [Leptospiraceae bacterium]